MKKNIKTNKLTLFILFLCTIILAGCEEGDGDADYGFPYIYIPQATVSGGLNNHYTVPDGAGIDTYNFKEENGKLKIRLSVLRSGKISGASGFTVDVLVMQNETEERVASGEISNAVVLPSGMYELPDKVTVKSGHDHETFYLTLDMEQLTHTSYTGKNLVLVVSIANPTRYELSDDNTTTTVIVDVDALMDILNEN